MQAVLSLVLLRSSPQHTHTHRQTDERCLPLFVTRLSSLDADSDA